MGVSHQQKNNEYFNEQAEKWDKMHFIQELADKALNTISKHVTLDKSMEVLDFGIGTGTLAEKIATKVLSVVGIDAAQAMVEKVNAKNIANLNAFCVEISDSSSFVIENTRRFDLIYSHMVMHHVENVPKMIATLSKLLKADGKLVIIDLERCDETVHAHNPKSVEFHNKKAAETVKHFGGFSKEFIDSIYDKAGLKPTFHSRVHSMKKPPGDNEHDHGTDSTEFPLFMAIGELE